MDTHLSFSRMHPITPNAVEPRIMWMKSTECTCHHQQQHPHPLRISFIQSVLLRRCRLRHCHVLRETSIWKFLGERILFVVIIVLFPGVVFVFLWIQSSTAKGGGGLRRGEAGGGREVEVTILFPIIVCYDHPNRRRRPVHSMPSSLLSLHNIIIANSNTSAQHIF